MQLPAVITRALGWAAFEFARIQPLVPTYLHLLASALFPIYTGSFSSLSRPSSAAKKSKKIEKDGSDGDTEDDDEEDEEEPRMEGLSPSDALMFPVLAGATLTGLYFLIKWLNDAALLNKILNWYFAGFSVFSVSRLVSDALDVLHSIIFPHNYISKNRLYHVEWKAKEARSDASIHRSPLPGFLSRLSLPRAINDLLWALHVLPNRKLQFRAVIRGLFSANFKLGIHGIEGLLVGLSTVLWYNFVSKPWYLTNLMGFGFAYGTLQLMSPTTFWTGTMILSGLFFYDIYFVFYTPMMVTVAKSLDIPIKLLFPRPPSPDQPSTIQAMSMLGLGDVVLPGIMIGLALRFDLYMHYLKKQTSSLAVESSTEVEVIKAPYQSVGEGWGDRLWTSSLLTGSSRTHGYVARNAFPKPYFHAGLIGYTLGMLVTLGAMQISDHAQPALLYLVPGVLTALWGTAWARSEFKHMWTFTEAPDEEGKDQKEADKLIAGADSDQKAEKSTEGKQTSFFSQERSEARVKRLDRAIAGKDDETDGADTKDQSTPHKKDVNSDRTLVSFSVSLPPPLALKHREPETTDTLADDSSRYNLRSNDTKSPERAEKRQRLA